MSRVFDRTRPAAAKSGKFSKSGRFVPVPTWTDSVLPDLDEKAGLPSSANPAKELILLRIDN